MNDILIQEAEEFDLAATLECGQCFRWNRQEDGSYLGVVQSKVLNIKKAENGILLKNVSQQEFKTFWAHYFDLDLNYSHIRSEISKIDKNLKEACDFAPGIRILKQDPWETLCSFIISQNNNIPRIKGIIENMCLRFGAHLFENFYSFPSADVISKLSLSDLSYLKCGFRDKYILDAAKKVSSGEINLESLSKITIEEARAKLMGIHGVGPKVAECVLLYGVHRLEAFPADVWIKRAMKNIFPQYSCNDFGKFAGIAQQYIYHYVRNSKKNFID